MTKLIDTIQQALAPDADDDAKLAGASACRAILGALEAQPGKPLAAAPAASSPLATAAQQLKSVPSTLVLDARIAKLRAHEHRVEHSASLVANAFIRLAVAVVIDEVAHLCRIGVEEDGWRWACLRNTPHLERDEYEDDSHAAGTLAKLPSSHDRFLSLGNVQ